jgi:Vitamin K-dependent gamma-carboxylase, lumenal domain
MFAWHMMLRDKVNLPRFLVADRHAEKTTEVDVSQWLNREQIEAVGRDPEMMREFAHYLRRKYEEKGGDIEVKVLALSSLNGRKPQPLIDPRVDLSREPRVLGHQRYIIPLQEKFRWERWTVPVDRWEAEMLKKE